MNIQIGRRASPAIAQPGTFLRERYFETTKESGFGGGGAAASGAAARGAGQMVELPLQEREPMTNWWSPQGWGCVAHRAQRDVRDC